MSCARLFARGAVFSKKSSAEHPPKLGDILISETTMTYRVPYAVAGRASHGDEGTLEFTVTDTAQPDIL